MSQRIRPLDEPRDAMPERRLPIALTRDEVRALLAVLDGRCATCNTPMGKRRAVTEGGAGANLMPTLGAVARDLTRMARRRGWLE